VKKMKKKDLNTQIAKVVMEIGAINITQRKNNGLLLSIMGEYVQKTLELDKKCLEKLEELQKLIK